MTRPVGAKSFLRIPVALAPHEARAGRAPLSLVARRSRALVEPARNPQIATLNALPDRADARKGLRATAWRFSGHSSGTCTITVGPSEDLEETIRTSEIFVARLSDQLNALGDALDALESYFDDCHAALRARDSRMWRSSLGDVIEQYQEILNAWARVDPYLEHSLYEPDYHAHMMPLIETTLKQGMKLGLMVAITPEEAIDEGLIESIASLDATIRNLRQTKPVAFLVQIADIQPFLLMHSNIEEISDVPPDAQLAAMDFKQAFGALNVSFGEMSVRALTSAEIVDLTRLSAETLEALVRLLEICDANPDLQALADAALNTFSADMVSVLNQALLLASYYDVNAHGDAILAPARRVYQAAASLEQKIGQRAASPWSGEDPTLFAAVTRWAHMAPLLIACGAESVLPQQERGMYHALHALEQASKGAVSQISELIHRMQSERSILMDLENIRATMQELLRTYAALLEQNYEPPSALQLDFEELVGFYLENPFIVFNAFSDLSSDARVKAVMQSLRRDMRDAVDAMVREAPEEAPGIELLIGIRRQMEDKMFDQVTGLGIVRPPSGVGDN